MNNVCEIEQKLVANKNTKLQTGVCVCIEGYACQQNLTSSTTLPTPPSPTHNPYIHLTPLPALTPLITLKPRQESLKPPLTLLIQRMR